MTHPAAQTVLLASLLGATNRTTPTNPPVEAPAIVSGQSPELFIRDSFARVFEEIKGIDSRVEAKLRSFQEDLVGNSVEAAMSSAAERDTAKIAQTRDAAEAKSRSRVWTERTVERDEELVACEIDMLARICRAKGRTSPDVLARNLVAEKVTRTALDGTTEHVPRYSARQIEHIQRSFRADSMSDGGALVPEQVNSEIVAYMREKLIPYNRGRKATLLHGSMKFPKQNSKPFVYWNGEQVAPTATKMAVGTQTMTLKKLSGMGVFSNESLDQVEGFRAYFLSELQKSIALEKQRAFYFGSGSEFQPLGIYYQTRAANKFARTKAGAASTYQEILIDLIKMQTILLRDNADGSGNFDMSSCAWLMNATVRGGLLTILDGQGQFRFLADMIASGSLFGVPFDNTEMVPRTSTTGGAALVGGALSLMGLIDYSQTTIGDSGRNSIRASDQATVPASSGTSINLFTQDSSALIIQTDQDQILHYDSAAVWLTDIDWLTIA